MENARIIRVLMAKVGVDIHDVGLRLVSRALRDSGIEVIYMGIFKEPEEVVSAAIQEDVDVIGLGALCGGCEQRIAEVKELLKARKADRPVIVGGIFSPRASAMLKATGIDRFFGPGTPVNEIVSYVKSVATTARG